MTNPGQPQGRRQRKLRNLLLDPHFQLKYTGYLVAIALLLSVSLGYVLFSTSNRLLEQSEKNVAQGAQIVALGGEVVDESRKVSEVVRMNIVNDPVYKDNPDLVEAFTRDAKTQDKRLARQRAQLEEQRQALSEDAQTLQRLHRTLLWSLLGVLAALVLSIGAAGIVVTHKVAGPIFKMKKHLREVAQGELKVPWGLRKGDELVDFFEAFREMVSSLRQQRERTVEELEAALAELELPPDRAQRLRALRDQLRAGLD